MSNHQKRLSVPKSWPVERKTETFTVKADAGPHGEAGVPLLVLLRDVLGYVDSRKEARYALNQENVIINGTIVSDAERPVGMFDILAFDEREEYYRVFPGEGGRLALTEIDADSAESKLGKIVGKRQIHGGDTQLTLHDGHTLVVENETAYDGGDSIVIANEDDEIVAHFSSEEGALVTAVAGAHAGEVGTIEEIQVTPGSSPNNVIVDQDGSAGGGKTAGFETIEDYVVVIDENFTSDEESAADTSGEEESAADASGEEDSAADASGEEDSAADASGEEDSAADASGEEESAADASGDEESAAVASGDEESAADASSDGDTGGDES